MVDFISQLEDTICDNLYVDFDEDENQYFAYITDKGMAKVMEIINREFGKRRAKIQGNIKSRPPATGTGE